MRYILPIARYTVLESLRNRLFWLAGLIVLGGFGLVQFLQQVAIIESQQVQTSLTAALFRFAAVFLQASFVIVSMARENNDKIWELMFSLPLSRAVYFLGKLGGFCVCAVLLATLFTLPLVLYADMTATLAWWLSLCCELIMVTTVALFCVFTLTQVTSALAVTFGFYLLARSIAAMQLIAAGSAAVPSLSQKIINLLVDNIALLLPRLDQMTQSAWLIYEAPSAAFLLHIAGQTALYVLLIGAAGAFDLYRKNI